MALEWARSAPCTTGTTGQCSTNALPLPEFPGLQLQSIHTQNYTFTPDPLLGGPLDPILGLNFCNITVTYTHPGWNDSITVTTFLPTTNWNGRFQANGGGGFITGGEATIQMTMIPSLIEGYAVSTTDGGHISSLADANPTDYDISWAFSSPGNINWPLLVDFASVALHDMATLGKAVTKAFYGEAASFSYFYGGSTGGRQGHMLAQRYPKDFDGIVAVMPAMNWDTFLFSNIWPPFVMDSHNMYPRPCEMEALTAAAVSACDELDDVKDGIISMPGLCKFDPYDVIDQEFTCDGVTTTFTSEGTTIAKAAWDGPRSSSGAFQWHGFAWDAKISQNGIGAAVTECDANTGNFSAVSFAISNVWARYWVQKDPAFSMATIAHEQWDELVHASQNEYASVIGSYDPDLSSFRRAGGKMINWHGMADQAIPMNGSVTYYDRVLAMDPKAHDFYRFYLAPGASHCFTCGPTPRNGMMEYMVDWVENGIAPETLRVVGEDGYGTWVKRDICMYPRVQHYIGGDPATPSAFKCV